MRFTCGECSAQYMISDDKIGTKGVRVRCKKCGNVITVRPKAESDTTEPEREDTQASGATDESLPDKTTVDQPEDGGGEFNVGDEEIGDALDNFLGDEGDEGDEGEFDDDEDRPDFDRQSTRVFSVDEMQKVQEEREQAEQEADERQQISELYQSAQAAEAGEAPGGEDEPADAASPPAEEPSGEEHERVEWYAAVDEQQVGPMSITEIGSRWKQGEFDAETLMWKTGFDDWIPIFEVSELKFLLAEREAPPAEEHAEDQDEMEEGEREEASGWGEDTWGEDEEEQEEGDAESEQDEEYYGEDDALSAASSAAFAGADVDWKPSAVAELNVLAEEELASLKPPPDPEPEEEQLPFGDDMDMAMSAEGDEIGETGEPGEMEDGDSSIIGQIAAEEEAAAKQVEVERAEDEKRSEEVRKKKEEEELVAQEAARREREEEKRKRAAPPPEQVIPSRGGIPKWALGVMGGSGLVIIILLGFIAYKLASGSGEDDVRPVAEAITPPSAEGVQPQPMTPPKGPATSPSPALTDAAKTASMAPSPESKPEAKDTAAEEKKPADTTKRKPPLGKKKKKKKKREKVVKAPREPPPPVEEKKPPPRPRTKPKKGSLLDFEDEAAFSKETGSKDPVKKPPPKPVKKELPPLSNADVLGVMRQHIAEFKACNRKQKEVDPSVKGKMVVSFIVNPNGRVSTVRVTTAQFKKTFVATCISKVIRQLNFPQFGGKPKKVPFPFTVK